MARRGRRRRLGEKALLAATVLLLAAPLPASAFVPPPPPPPSSLPRVVCRAASSPSSGSPGYVRRNGPPPPAASGGSRPRRRPPPPPPSAPPPAAASSSSSSLVSASSGSSSAEPWVQAFARLQGMESRTPGDYEAAFDICAAAGRPFECFSLVRFMAKDGLPRPPRLYEATARLAAAQDNWVTVLDAYLVYERKEQLDPACPATRALVELALQAAERLGKGSRAVRIHQRATGDLDPPMEAWPAAALALRACFRAGTFDLGLPFALTVLQPVLLRKDGEEALDVEDASALGVAIATLAKGGCAEEAAVALDALRGRSSSSNQDLSPDVAACGAVIEGLAAEGSLDRAMALGAAMEQGEGGLPAPNTVVRSILAQACCRAGRLEEAWALLRAIPEAEREVHRTQPLWALATREGHEGAIAWLLEDLARWPDGSGATLPVPAYHAALCNLARLGMVAPAERLAELVLAKGRTARGKANGKGNGKERCHTDMTFYALVACCEKAGEHARLLEWFGAMLRAGVDPDPVRYGMALQACERLGKWQAGLAIVTRMRDRGHAMDPALWKRLFLLLGREARGDEALALLGEMEAREGEQQRPEPICYEAAITALSRMGDQARAIAALVEFEEAKGVPLGRAAYTSAIAACREAKDAEAALRLYARMRRRSTEPPSTVTRAALLDVLVAAGRMAEAAHVAEEQEASGDPVPAHMQGNMVLAHSARQDFPAVLRYFGPLWERRLDKALPLPWALCNAALQACARVGDGDGGDDEAEGQHQHHQHQRKQKQEKAQQQHHHALALEILEMMRGAEAGVDVVMYGCVLAALARAGEWRPAFRLLKQMEAEADAGAPGAVRPNLVCYTNVITALQQGQEWRKALNLLVRMLNAGPAPDCQTYNAVMAACANAGESQMALRIFQAMKVQGIAPDEVTYATAVVACWRGGEWRQAVELLQAMKAEGHAPNMITVTLVIDVCDRARQFDLAANLFEANVVGFIRSEDYEMGSEGPGMVVDLHGYSQPVAKAAIRAGLKRLGQMYLNSGRDPRGIKDFVFITGVGRHSETPFEPVLRPAMEQMLTADFDPPLPSHMVENNPGRMVVRAPDLLRWLDAQTAARAPTPAELRAGTLRLRSAADLEASFGEFQQHQKEKERHMRAFFSAATELAAKDEQERREKEES